MKEVLEYLRFRSEVLNTPFNKSVEDLRNLFSLGMMNLFGVQLDNEGNIVGDDRYPSLLFMYEINKN